MRDRLFLRLPEDELHGPEAGPLAPAALRAFTPHAVLQPFVGSILRYRESLAAGEELREHVVPDGSLRLVINLGDAPGSDDGPGLAAGVIGASAAPVQVTLRGRMHAYSVTLKPGASLALFGMPAGDFSGTQVSVEDLWGADGTALRERMADARSEPARVHILQSTLAQRLRTPAAPAGPAQHAMRLMAAGALPLREVAARLGLSERRLQQLFQSDVGLPPRTWRRLLRLQACLRRLRDHQGPPRWAELASDCGFYDQAHLANEFQALCGMTPGEYWRSTVSHSSKTSA
ncbi:MAG TPA: helix-turn-helix transcriptional regulator [Rhizobacter sp.]